MHPVRSAVVLVAAGILAVPLAVHVILRPRRAAHTSRQVA